MNTDRAFCVSYADKRAKIFLATDAHVTYTDKGVGVVQLSCGALNNFIFIRWFSVKICVLIFYWTRMNADEHG